MSIAEPIAPPELEQRALTRQQRACAIKISDQASLELAAEELRGIVSLRKEIVDHHAPLKQTTHAAWQAAIAAEKRVLEPVAEAERIIKGEIGRYTTEQERIRREQERLLRAEQDRLQREADERLRLEQEALNRQHEEQIESEIEQAEERGATAEHIAELASRPAPVIASEPVFMPAPVLPSRVAPVAGISTRETWSAEVVSIRQLAAEVGSGRVAEEALIGLNRDAKTGKVSSPALNKMASALKAALKIPGVRSVPTSSVAARSSR